MGKHRIGRVGETIKEEISQIVREEIKDPRVGFVTVTGVEVAPDFGHAKVFVSVMGNPEEVKASMQALNGAAGFVRTELGSRIRLRHTPEIVFRLDHSIEQGLKISSLLNQVLHDTRNGKED